MKKFENLCDYSKNIVRIASMNPIDEILDYFEKKLGYDVSNIGVFEHYQEQIVNEDQFILEVDYRVYEFRVKDQYVDFKEILEENDIPILPIGSLWNGAMQHKRSYYASALGKENPEEYDKLEESDVKVFDMFCEYVDRKAEEYVNEYLFIGIKVINE